VVPWRASATQQSPPPTRQNLHSQAETALVITVEMQHARAGLGGHALAARSDAPPFSSTLSLPRNKSA